MSAYQAGNVTLAHAVGTGVADDKAVSASPIILIMCWTTSMSWCELVVKGVHASGGLRASRAAAASGMSYCSALPPGLLPGSTNGFSSLRPSLGGRAASAGWQCSRVARHTVFRRNRPLPLAHVDLAPPAPITSLLVRSAIRMAKLRGSRRSLRAGEELQVRLKGNWACCSPWLQTQND
jgi:hypothetical protein